MPVKTGIQKLLKLLDSPVSSTVQAYRRAALARNDKILITTQSLRGNDNFMTARLNSQRQGARDTRDETYVMYVAVTSDEVLRRMWAFKQSVRVWRWQTT